MLHQKETRPPRQSSRIFYVIAFDWRGQYISWTVKLWTESFRVLSKEDAARNVSRSPPPEPARSWRTTSAREPAYSSHGPNIDFPLEGESFIRFLQTFSPLAVPWQPSIPLGRKTSRSCHFLSNKLGRPPARGPVLFAQRHCTPLSRCVCYTPAQHVTGAGGKQKKNIRQSDGKGRLDWNDLPRPVCPCVWAATGCTHSSMSGLIQST